MASASESMVSKNCERAAKGLKSGPDVDLKLGTEGRRNVRREAQVTKPAAG